jgi:very-short-patch-repair endonuclease
LRVALEIVGTFVDGVGYELAVRPARQDDATDPRVVALVELAGPVAVLVIASDVGRVEDTAVALAETLPRAHVAVVIDAGTAEALWSKSDRASTVLRQWLVRPAPPTRAAEGGRSQPERDLWQALERDTRTRGRFRLGERVDVLHGGQPAEIDLYDRELAVAVEVDGIHHFRDVEGFRRDRRKDVALQRAGILIYRVHTDDVAHRVEHEVDVIAGLLTFRRAARASVRGVP